MKRLMSVATIGALALFGAISTDVAAQDFNLQERTIVTFSQPVELPGTSLPAGTYVFRIADTATRDVVQVLSENEQEMLGQFTYVPAKRQEVTGETVVTFSEATAGSTPALQYWFYPGDMLGVEFVYPEDQAMEIAERTGVAVMTEEGRVSPGGTAGAAATTGTVEVERDEAEIDLDNPDVDVEAESDEDEAEIEIETDKVETELEVEPEN